MKMNHQLEPVDIIFVLCSRDGRVANYAAKLYQQGLSKLVLISGKTVHADDILATK